MRWGVALCVVCAAVAALTGGSLAQVADEEEDDDDPPAAAGTSFRSWSLFDPPGPSAPPFDFLTGGMPDRMLYFSGVEAQRWGLAAYAGAQWAPARIDRDGFILRMLMSDSLNRFTKAKHRTDTQILRGAVLPGYKFSYRTFELQVLAGVGSELDVKSAKGSATGWQVKFGAQVVADLWWEPSRDWMVQASVSATTIDHTLNTRVAAGWRLFDRFWIGPEFAASQDDYSRQYRIGAQLTGLRSDELEWSVTAGHVRDSYQREGVYGRIGVVIRPPRTLHLD